MPAQGPAEPSEPDALSRVVASQNAQLRALNEANLLLSEESELPVVLQRVVDLSRELVGARYAALAVSKGVGGLEAVRSPHPKGYRRRRIVAQVCPLPCDAVAVGPPY